MADSPPPPPSPSSLAVLVLGGCGYIGRNLTQKLLSSGHCSLIKVVDKTIPEMSYFHEQHSEVFESPLVLFEQNDLTKEAHVARAFTVPTALDKSCFDVVINVAAETRQAQPVALYQSRCTQLAKLCAEKAAECGVSRFIQVSTAQVYNCSTSVNPKKKPATETSDIDPWTSEAQCMYDGEVEVLSFQDRMEVVILRLAYVYGGSGDSQMMMTRAVCGAVYKELQEEMTFLWGGQMKINSVHISDVCRAIEHCLNKSNIQRSTVWNICDKTDTDQAHISKILKAVFKIKCDFYGRILSNIASLRMKEVVNTANEKHLKPWNDACMRDNILNTPLSPYMSTDWLDCHHLHVSGISIEKTGFQYMHPIMTEELFREGVRLAIECKTFPPSSYSE